MNHQDEAERLMEFGQWTETKALTHAVLALVDTLKDLPVVGFQVVEELDEDDEEEDWIDPVHSLRQ